MTTSENANAKPDTMVDALLKLPLPKPNLAVGTKVMRFGEFGVVTESNAEDIKISFMNGPTEIILAQPTGGILIEWNEMGQHYCRRYSFAQIADLGIKVIG